jgi:hypothetical protein
VPQTGTPDSQNLEANRLAETSLILKMVTLELHYTNMCKFLEHIDADTYKVMIDLGYDQFTKQIIRMYGLNCPGEHEPGHPASLKYVLDWFAMNADNKIFVTTRQDISSKDNFGRYLGTFHAVNNGVISCLNDELINNKLATPFMQNVKRKRQFSLGQGVQTHD